MIWEAEEEGGDREAMSRHLEGRILEWVPGGDGVWCGAVSRMAADIWERDLGGRPVPEDFFALLAARVLWRMGDPVGAWRVLSRVRPSWVGEEGIAAAVLGSGDSDLPLLVHVSGGVVWPVVGGVWGTGPEWGLDLGRIAAMAQGELGLLPRLRKLVEQVSGTWDGTGGVGGVRLRGDRREAGAACRYCRTVLSRLGPDRGWERVPDVRWERLALRR